MNFIVSCCAAACLRKTFPRHPSSFSDGHALPVEQLLQILFKRRVYNAALRYDSGQKLMIGHVEGRVVALDLLQCHRLRVPHILDFLRIALLDVNVSSCRRVEVNRGGRSQGVERDSVVLCQDRNTGGANLVGKIAVCRNAVAADEYGVHPAS